jgi:hypothetical protein
MVSLLSHISTLLLNMGRIPTACANTRVSPMGRHPITPSKYCLGVESNQDTLVNGSLGSPTLGKTKPQNANNKRLENALIMIAVPKPTQVPTEGQKISSVEMCIATQCKSNVSNIGCWFQKVSTYCRFSKTSSYFCCPGIHKRQASQNLLFK